MISVLEIFVILFVHWYADFALQTHWQATNKSKDNLALTLHVTTYSLSWIGPIAVLLYYYSNDVYSAILFGFIFSVITFCVHWIIDYFTSRLNTKLWFKNDMHNFFVSVGFDQFLHFVQLFITYIILKTL